MIKFSKIRYRNLLSTGNQFTEINFLKNQTNLIIGNNGAGKSTVLDALTFVLFNKSFRGANKPQLINNTNEKDCVVEVEFETNNKKYLIRRGIKPNIFDIVIDGVPLHKEADERSNQRLLEETILKVNYKSFTQIVILGASNFTPFMQLTPANRREVIEDLLDIRIFSAMNTLVKEKIRKKKEEIQLLGLQKRSCSDKIEMQQNFITELNNRGLLDIQAKKEKIDKLFSEVETHLNENVELEKKIESNTIEQKKSITSDGNLKKLGLLEGKLSQKIHSHKEDCTFFENTTVCPTCTQDIEESLRHEKIQSYNDKIKELDDLYDKLKTDINLEEEKKKTFAQISSLIARLNHEVSKNNIIIHSNQKQIKNLETEITELNQQLQNQTAENLKLEEFTGKLATIKESLSDKKTEMLNYEYTYSLLKDDGVKTKIIKKYLPFINQQVNRYLQLMDFYINFTLDQEFNETIKSAIHENFTYGSFSEGEKAKIDLSLIFAWREVARLKNSVNCNILLFDEVFDSSLDSFGAEEFLKIIKYVIKDTNIFVISHKTGIEEKFGAVIKFEKRNGFSHKIDIA